MGTFIKYFSYLCVFTALQAWAGDKEEQKEDEKSGETAQEQPVLKLKPGEKKVIVKRTVVTIKTTDSGTEGDIVGEERPSWRCKNIPDDAFLRLGTYTPKGKAVATSRKEWEKRAAEFVATYSGNCPNYAALEKEIPPWLNQKKYTQMLSSLFDLNRMTTIEGLLRIARDNEVEDSLEAFRKKSDKKKPSQKYLETFKVEHQELLRRASGARAMIELKFSDELKLFFEANSIVMTFMGDFLDSNGNVKNENTAKLKAFLKGLSSQQKQAVKNYLHNILTRTEYPKSNLLPTKEQSELAEEKESRELASFVRKESNRKFAVQMLLFELE